mmetsp:Transcript_29491/g.33786  ORF Transcript_29491/g.33786 Transcript_29491/m.33786 type:complete len:191 (+) Transcript_29491:286-858(+)|eukprot:CAMPEP_0168319904 /NCGR_PEP_ID=MMETSP0213-20121227/1330_1 /TAXON_ID=151035 /ORGANISM="Euplotes harpa, Strain FSP1.4" /LENGTH=190 /DNA_ID=CAMNT_0008321207 /DNA_START=444 /DNA_END=1016 /DNA_ORIENTATION=+
MTNFRVMDYIWDNTKSVIIELKNFRPSLATQLEILTVTVGETLTIDLVFDDTENDKVSFEFQSLSSSLSSTSQVSEVDVNHYLVTWVPSEEDKGDHLITLVYFDQFHQIIQTSTDFSISVTKVTKPRFKTALNNQTVFAGQLAQFDLAEIVNESGAEIALSIRVEDINSTTVDASDWITLASRTLKTFPK